MSDSHGFSSLELATTALVALPVAVILVRVAGGTAIHDLTAEYFTAAFGTVFLSLYSLALARLLRGKGGEAADTVFPSKMFALAMLLVSATVAASGAWAAAGGATLGGCSLYALLSLFAAWVGYVMVTAGQRRLVSPAR